MALSPPSIHSLTGTNQITLKPETSPCGHILIALGVIALIGSLVANGCLYSQQGYTSFAIGGSGIAACILCLLLSRLTVTQDIPVTEPSQESNSLDYSASTDTISETGAEFDTSEIETEGDSQETQVECQTQILEDAVLERRISDLERSHTETRTRLSEIESL